MSETPKNSSDGRHPTIDVLQHDIERANIYRLELIKSMLAIATAVLAFTVSFRPTIINPDWVPLMWAGWLGLGFSIIGGLINMWGWERFYISYRDYDWKQKKDVGKRHRKKITAWRRIAMFIQFSCLVIGILSVACFTAENIGKPHVLLPSENSITTHER